MTPLWVCQALWGHTKKHCVKFSFWKLPGACDMTIFGAHVGRHISNIGHFRYLEVFGGIWKYIL